MIVSVNKHRMNYSKLSILRNNRNSINTLNHNEYQSPSSDKSSGNGGPVKIPSSDGIIINKETKSIRSLIDWIWSIYNFPSSKWLIIYLESFIIRYHVSILRQNNY